LLSIARMSMTRIVLGLTLLVSAPLAACSSEDPGPPGEPSTIGAILADHLGGVADAPGGVVPLGFRLSQLAQVDPTAAVTDDNCEGPLQNDLWQACDEIQRAGLAHSCGVTSAFFFAHDTPRCGVRIVLWQDETFTELPDLIAFDLSGSPIVGWEQHCGNGFIDFNTPEECDDGNHDEWDGCDANCHVEEFTGCETVIEHYFDQAEIAHVDASTWSEPRSHLMIHDDAQPLRPVDASLCNAASGVAQDVCNELTATMGFVSYCAPVVEFEAGACNVRLEVSFSRASPTDAVFTTRLTGILAFTIK
jgi:cysteine-rich repeat protein